MPLDLAVETVEQAETVAIGVVRRHARALRQAKHDNTYAEVA